MTSPYCERAIEDALKHGNALLKFISRNNVGLTGSHECGFYLPKIVHGLFTPHGPEKGANSKHDLTITWQDGRVTESVITFYGNKTRSEYRLTRFGKDFPFLNEGVVGDMLVLISTAPGEALAYVLDFDEDIEEIQSTLGVDAFGKWGVFIDGAPATEENEDACVERRIRQFSAGFTSFPPNDVFSAATLDILKGCSKKFSKKPLDLVLVEAYSTEYELFRAVERIVCQNDVSGRLFKDIDDFLKVAGSIMNRRKSRAGRSFENHVHAILEAAKVPHKMRPDLGPDGTPDIIIPSQEAYLDPSCPPEKLMVVGLKTTCKDRWRQVTQEGLKVPRKHLITLQQGVTATQLKQMEAANVSLVVPTPFHKHYPSDGVVQPLTMESFVEAARRLTIRD
ncbi:type II restriction endonuclease [Granulicella cerasi]|uniref:Type II restriction endonuclease n=1 Tax=Granulicella cerasi TaxID=741063 RepID=A0ABW1Z931_9BACT|nr:type II restriction endonuclease [Granulicella cerasi]